MKKTLVMILLATAASGSASAFWRRSGLPQVSCENDKAYLQSVTYGSACIIPGKMYISESRLHTDDGVTGSLWLNVKYRPTVRVPCDNPRGMPFFETIPLQLAQGEWKVEVEGGSTYRVTLTRESCEVEPIE
jgi:hypothetical protein